MINRHLIHQISSLLGDEISLSMDDEIKYTFFKILEKWKEKISFPDTKWPKVIPYSTEEFIDKASLALIPLVSSAGYFVPKIYECDLINRKRTSNKLQSIQGFKTYLSPKEIKDQLCRVGAVFFLQPELIFSFFRKLIATNSVNSFENYVHLLRCCLVSSIIVGDLRGIVFNITVGEETPIKNSQKAKNLARSFKNICDCLKINNSFFLSNMNQPLGQAIGNSLEIKEILELLKGRGPSDVLKLVLELGAEMLLIGKMFTNRIEAKKILKQKIINGDALIKFEEIIKAQKGNPQIIENYSLLPMAEKRIKILSKKKGYIQHFKMKQIRSIIGELRAEGKKTTMNSIDHGAGFLILKKIGDRVEKGEELAEIHFNKLRDVSLSKEEFSEIFTISESPPDYQPLIIERIK